MPRSPLSRKEPTPAELFYDVYATEIRPDTDWPAWSHLSADEQQRIDALRLRLLALATKSQDPEDTEDATL